MSAESRRTPPQTVSPGMNVLAPGPPFLRAPEDVWSIQRTLFRPAGALVLVGLALFGWPTAFVPVLCVVSCLVFEWFCRRLRGAGPPRAQTAAMLTGLLLALTLPPFVPWYVPVLGAAAAMIVGHAAFGDTGDYLWPPARVGRLAVAMLVPAAVVNPPTWPAPWDQAAPSGSVADVREPAKLVDGLDAETPREAALRARPPRAILAELTMDRRGAASGISTVLRKLPRPTDMILGRRAGALGETCALMILTAGLYLIHRNYVRWRIPLAVLVSACIVAAVAPVFQAAGGQSVRTVWAPLWAEGWGIGLIYCGYQVVGGGMLLATFILSADMTSRPVTPRGQLLFGIGCGTLGMLGQLYVPISIPCYAAVLVMCTVAGLVDGAGRRRTAAGKPADSRRGVQGGTIFL